MATKHYVADYEIEKKGKVVKSGTIQFERVNAPEDEDEEEAFADVRPQYENGGLRLKRETFREVKAVGEVKTDAEGNIVDRPAVVIPPATPRIIVPPGVPHVE